MWRLNPNTLSRKNGNAVGTQKDIKGKDDSVVNQVAVGSMKQINEGSVELTPSNQKMDTILDCFELKKICLFPIKSCGGFEVRKVEYVEQPVLSQLHNLRFMTSAYSRN